MSQLLPMCAKTDRKSQVDERVMLTGILYYVVPVVCECME